MCGGSLISSLCPCFSYLKESLSELVELFLANNLMTDLAFFYVCELSEQFCSLLVIGQGIVD